MRGPIARSTIRTGLVLGMRLVIQVGTLLIVARLLGTQTFGAFAAICALAVLIGALSPCGTHLMLLRDLSQNQARRDASLCYALGTSFASGSVLLSAYMAICAFWFSDLGIPLWVPLCVGIAEILIQPFILITASEQQAGQRVARSQMLVILPLLLRLLAAVAAWLAVEHQNALSTYALGYLVASVLALAVCVAVLPRSWPHPRNWRLLRGPEWKEGSGFGLLGLSSRGPSELDKVLAAQILPLNLAGAYTLAARVVGAATLPVSAMMLSALPRLFKGPAEPGSSRLKWTIFIASAGYGVIAGGALWLISPWTHLLLGEGYGPAEQMLGMLSFAAPALCLRVAASNTLMSTHGPWKRIMVEVAGIATLLTVLVVAASHAPIAALPLAYVISEWLMAVLAWALAARSSHVNRSMAARSQ